MERTRHGRVAYSHPVKKQTFHCLIVLREVLYYFALEIGSECGFSRAVAVKFCYFRLIWVLKCQPKEFTRKLFQELRILLIMAKAGCELTKRKARKIPYKRPSNWARHSHGFFISWYMILVYSRRSTQSAGRHTVGKYIPSWKWYPYLYPPPTPALAVDYLC